MITKIPRVRPQPLLNVAWVVTREQTIAQKLPESPHWLPAHLACAPPPLLGPWHDLCRVPRLWGPVGSASQLSALVSSLQNSPSALAHPGPQSCLLPRLSKHPEDLTQLSTSHPHGRSRCMNSRVDTGSCLSHRRSSVALSTLPQQESQSSSPASPTPPGPLLLGTPGRS